MGVGGILRGITHPFLTTTCTPRREWWLQKKVCLKKRFIKCSVKKSVSVLICIANATLIFLFVSLRFHSDARTVSTGWRLQWWTSGQGCTWEWRRPGMRTGTTLPALCTMKAGPSTSPPMTGRRRSTASWLSWLWRLVLTGSTMSPNITSTAR